MVKRSGVFCWVGGVGVYVEVGTGWGGGWGGGWAFFGGGRVGVVGKLVGCGVEGLGVL